jgi:WD40 repeat protein
MFYLPDLQELDLVSTKVTDAGLPAIRKAPFLKSLWVFKTEVTQEALDQLQRDMPHLQIVKKQPDPVAGGMAMHQIYRHAIVSVTVEPRSGLLALGNGEGQLRFWRPGEAEPQRPIAAHEDWLFSVAFSNDGRRLATGGGDGLIKLWDVASGKQTGQLAGHLDDVHAVAFSLDDKSLASASDDMTIRIWELTNNQQRFVLEGHTGTIPNMVISPDGRTIASASRDDTVRLWDLESGKLVRVLAGHTDDVMSVSFSPDSRQLASASYDGTVRVWNLGEPADCKILSGHRDRVFSVAFNSSGSQLASGGVDGLRLWDARSRELLDYFPDQTYIAAVRFTEDDTVLASATAEGELLLRHLPDGAVIREWRDPESLPPPNTPKPESLKELARN